MMSLWFAVQIARSWFLLARYLHFWHYYDLEWAADGAVVQLSKDGGASWADAFTSAPYTSSISGSFEDCDFSPMLAGKTAWSGTIGENEWTRVSIHIPPAFRTEQFQFRFVFETDESNQSSGWFIDDISIAPQ